MFFRLGEGRDGGLALSFNYFYLILGESIFLPSPYFHFLDGGIVHRDFAACFVVGVGFFGFYGATIQPNAPIFSAI